MAVGRVPSCSASATTYFCLTYCLVDVIESGGSIGPDGVESVFLPKRFLEPRSRRNLESEAVTRTKVGASARTGGRLGPLASELLPQSLVSVVRSNTMQHWISRLHLVGKCRFQVARSSDIRRARGMLDRSYLGRKSDVNGSWVTL